MDMYYDEASTSLNVPSGLSLSLRERARVRGIVYAPLTQTLSPGAGERENSLLFS
jgi:hypothetical protein